MEKNYSPTGTEEKWYKFWTDSGFMHSVPDQREAFTVVIPPPNITGVLHMGHTLNETIQDIVVRRARMLGKNACWVPGTDHASIATEAKVVAMLKEKGIEKNSISREEFLKHAFEWKEKYGGIILEQFRRLGCSCDWERTAFTMDESYYKAVIKVFVDLYNKGLIYRGVRMIHWDPKAQTALSDEEVIYKESKSKLYFVKYKLEEGGFISIATTRPETILGDVAVCVHPDDARYKHLQGKFCFVPAINRRVPVITDDYIDREFGTGALKVTPAHDINDYKIGMKHQLQTIDVFNPNGTMSAAAGMFVGEDRFAVRKKMAKLLEEEGLLEKVEEISNNVGHSERTDAVIEPRLSLQWFMKMEELAKPALDAVVKGDVKFVPDKFTNTYKHWMNNIRDWCISRQLWWGQRIPAWYINGSNEFVVAQNKIEALFQAKLKTGKLESEISLKQDEDVLDTWFSSWLWPSQVFNGINDPGNKDVRYYYPTSVLVTGPDIIFFWVARMIMMGIEFEKQIPFHTVYFTGIIRDKLGRKMSKQYGNSPDLLGLIDQYGSDAVRFGILISSPAGNDLLFDEKLCEQGRNFNNKLWNALRLVKGWEVVDKAPADDLAVKWFEEKLSASLLEINRQMDEFNLSGALKTVYSLVWDDFCSWYLEWIKPPFGEPIERKTFEKTVEFFEVLVQILHPFIPFVTEEIYQHLKPRSSNESIMISRWPEMKISSGEFLKHGENAKEIISKIRDARNKSGLSPKEAAPLSIKTNSKDPFHSILSILTKSANLSEIVFSDEEINDALNFLVGTSQFYFITPRKTDSAIERVRLEEELLHQRGFLDSVNKKLSNEKFVSNAKKELVDKEKQKQTDALARISAIEAQLLSMN